MNDNQKLITKAVVVGVASGVAVVLILVLMGVDTYVGGALATSAMASANVVNEHYKKLLDTKEISSDQRHSVRQNE